MCLIDSTEHVTFWFAAPTINQLISRQHQTKTIHFFNSTKDLMILLTASNVKKHLSTSPNQIT
jgi:hypothetical protein